MMALSNYEYGGTTFEELNHLAEQREKVPRPSAEPNVNRIFTTLKPNTEEISLQQFHAVESTDLEKDFPKPPPAPFDKRLRDDVENGGAEGNPFEEIVTRAPLGFQRMRKRVRMHNEDFSVPRFLSRSSIIHPSTKPPPTTTKTPINDPKEGFEDVFVMPHARKLQQRDFDYEDHLQSEWAKKNEAKMSYRRHSGQNMTTPEQEEMAASYRMIKGKLQGETVVDSYCTVFDVGKVSAKKYICTS
ncbi:unnamed protein product, partial [Mesorhabditis belari]|uniref:Uncharacterized protein n=1 Tax=Mesorhabditis belari TaxID=2138241 RepID=A0AAF3EYL3_9BILA